jgi:probable HAF family extracellular repeat protein
MVDLGTLGGTTSYAYACSSDGSVIVGMSYTVAAYAHAFRWTQAGGMVDLGTLGGTSSVAQGVKFYV